IFAVFFRSLRWVTASTRLRVSAMMNIVWPDDFPPESARAWEIFSCASRASIAASCDGADGSGGGVRATGAWSGGGAPLMRVEAHVAVVAAADADHRLRRHRRRALQAAGEMRESNQVPLFCVISVVSSSSW